MNGLAERVADLVGIPVRGLSLLGTGATGNVHLADLADGTRVVVKFTARAEGEGLLVESRMLELLAARSALPVPRVLAAAPDILVMEYRAGCSSFDADAERHAAELLAALHSIRSDDGRYGLDSDALIGPLHQPNAWSASWIEFWRDRRILHMTRCALREGQLERPLGDRLERLASRLPDFIPDHPAASLIHGDVWSGNVLADAGRVTAFLDPAPYYAHHEVELAFITMFSTFGDEFFRRYAELGEPVDQHFWHARRHVYMIFPLLVHVRLFGGAYVGRLDATLGMLGH